MAHAVVGLRLLPRDGYDEFRRTDDLGRFRFPTLSPGNYELTLMAPNWPETSRELTLTETSDLLDVELRLPDGESLVVRLSESSGAPIEGLRVKVARAEGRADARGEATFHGLPERRATINVCVYPDHLYLDPGNLPVVPRGQVVDVVLQRTSRIRGVVRGPGGTLLPYMTVRGRYGDEERTAGTGDDGHFSLKAPTGVPVDISVKGPDLWTSRWGNAELGVKDPDTRQFRGHLAGVLAPAEDVEILAATMPYDRTLTLRVLDPDGKPVAGLRPWISAYGYEGRRDLATGEDGRVTFHGLPGEGIDIAVSVGRHRGWTKPEVNDLVPDGQEITLQFER